MKFSLMLAAALFCSCITFSQKNYQYGVFVSDTTIRTTVADELGVGWLRLKDCNINTPIYQRITNFQALGYKIALTFTDSVYPAHFPKSVKAYAHKLDSVLNKIKPDLVVIENEELNTTQHEGDLSYYLPMIDTAITIAHKYKLKVTNGGIPDKQLVALTYNDYVVRGLADSASWFLKATQIYGRLTPDQLTQIQNYITNYKAHKLDYFNIHWYGDSTENPSVDAAVAAYLRRLGIQTISNETGQHDLSGVTVITEMTAFNGLPILIWFSNDGKAAKALQNTNASLRSNGETFRGITVP